MRSKILCVAVAVMLCCAMPLRASAARGSATIVMEAETATVLYGTNERLRLPMASTTKIMTALLALEQPEIDSRFVVDSNAIRVEGSSMGLCEGDNVSLRALAGGMLTASGNDAANAAAVAIAGAVEPFAELMNARAAKIGMTDTHFVTPSGLDDEEHYSTAYDMALLAREALNNPTFLEMCSAKRLTLYFGNPPYDRTLYNHNRLLSLYPEAIGVKTGFTKTAGRCLVSAARRDGVTLIAVTLNVGDDWNVHRGLYEKFFDSVQRTSYPKPAGLSANVVGGTETTLPVEQSEEISVISINGKQPTLAAEIFMPNFLYAPIKKGDIVGKIVYYRDSNPVGEARLLAAKSLDVAPEEPQGRWERAWAGIEDWLWQRMGD